MSQRGPVFFPGGHFGKYFYLAGQAFEAVTPLEWVPLSAVPGQRTLVGGHLQQRLFRGGTAPASLRAMTTTVTIASIAREEERQAINDALASGGLVPICDLAEISDQWDAVSGQAVFSLARSIAFGAGLSGVTVGSFPPSATLNGVPQAVIFSGSPSSGQVLLSIAAPDLTTGAGQFQAVTTPPLAAADILTLRYQAIKWCKMDPDEIYNSKNFLSWKGTLTEEFPGRWD